MQCDNTAINALHQKCTKLEMPTKHASESVVCNLQQLSSDIALKFQKVQSRSAETNSLFGVCVGKVVSFVHIKLDSKLRQTF